MSLEVLQGLWDHSLSFTPPLKKKHPENLQQLYLFLYLPHPFAFDMIRPTCGIRGGLRILMSPAQNFFQSDLLQKKKEGGGERAGTKGDSKWAKASLFLSRFKSVRILIQSHSPFSM